MGSDCAVGNALKFTVALDSVVGATLVAVNMTSHRPSRGVALAEILTAAPMLLMDVLIIARYSGATPDVMPKIDDTRLEQKLWALHLLVPAGILAHGVLTWVGTGRASSRAAIWLPTAVSDGRQVGLGLGVLRAF